MKPDGIQRIRTSLGFGDREEALLRGAAPRLIPEVPNWVDRFYAHLVVDPTAMALLKDEASVIRLKRSLNAWFLELFSLPYDSAYERARAGIGLTHVRIGMPQHLMVTAMGGIRRDAADTIARLYASEPETGRRALAALDKAFDMELALMLEQYRKRSRELAHETDRARITERTARRLAAATRNRVDAALCWAELLRRSADGPERERCFARIADALEGIARLGRGAPGTVPAAGGAPEVVPVADLCAHALSNVSLPLHTRLTITVEPPALSARVHRVPLERAVEELLQNAAHRDPSGSVRLYARPDGEGVVVEVTDAGPGWPADARDAEEALDADLSAALAHAEYAADLHDGSVDLFAAPGGGAGVRLRLKKARGGKEDSDADLVEDPGRVAP